MVVNVDQLKDGSKQVVTLFSESQADSKWDQVIGLSADCTHETSAKAGSSPTETERVFMDLDVSVTDRVVSQRF